MVTGDFRFKRYKLPPEAFAIGPKKEPEPSDLVDEKTWRDLVWLTDDVSLRTSEHHGTLLRKANQLTGHWIEMVLDIQSLIQNPRDDALALACLDVYDDLQASIYTMLTGFYRQSIATLRMALEETLAGAYFRAYPNSTKVQQWADGLREGQLWVREIRKKLSKIEPYSFFETGEYKLCGKDGWVDFLYGRLSGFSHGRPFYTDEEGNRVPTSNVGLWGGSNGPVYEPRAVKLWSAFFFDTALLCLVLVGLAEKRLLDLERPTSISFKEFLERAIFWHLDIAPPHPVAREIVRFLGLL
ncbi:hypothetical protein G7K71_02640 [Desulfofundulus sp. TPOSR]|uniref:hypothetical protein n=1 Tax=Desulfofundulus sp. TPOSR TaxID=2714340 RepID=UPI00140E5505|nr:hypothetical protein [Desulfofundulus sp. TPOSR]NHM25923.1 hypothetical protein [Desulfofundulus sp. TPOSR]